MGTCLQHGALFLGTLLQLLHGLLEVLVSLKNHQGVFGSAGQPQVRPVMLDLGEGPLHGADVLQDHLEKCTGGRITQQIHL